MNLITNPGSSSPAEVRGAAVRLSVVITSWNTCDLLEACLTSLERARVPEYAEVIVFDNASSDNSVAMARERFPWAKLIVSEENLGFSRGNNAAIRYAAGEHILLLNSDTEVDPGTIDAMLACAEKHKDVGVVGVAQRGADGSVQYEAAISLPTAWNVFCDLAMLSKIFPHSRLFARRKLGWWDHRSDREVPAVAGSALMVRREVLRRIGLLDERMFYCEDIDLCLRARQSGWRVYFIGVHSLIHHGGGSTKRSKKEGRQRQIAFQSFWLFARKHRGPWAAGCVSAMVYGWSLAATCAAGLYFVLAAGDGEKRDAARRFGKLARSLREWSRADKLSFRHHLAAPPDLEGGVPYLEEPAR